jgi:transposase InsO family protein
MACSPARGMRRVEPVWNCQFPASGGSDRAEIFELCRAHRELEFLKGASASAARRRNAPTSVINGYRRVGAALRHQGIVVNSKRVRRLMRGHDLQPRRRRRSVATTDSDHDRPIFPDRAKGMVVDAPNQLWVSDITYIAIAAGFVYLAAILDAWSRRVVGYAISRSLDARLTLAALQAALRTPRPPWGCVHPPQEP